MPLYEFICLDCGKQFTFLSGVIARNEEPHCPVCHSAKLKKLISRVSRGRSDDARMEAAAERLEQREIESSGEFARLAREVGSEIAAESGGDLSAEIEELIEQEAHTRKTASGGSDDGKIY